MTEANAVPCVDVFIGLGGILYKKCDVNNYRKLRKDKRTIILDDEHKVLFCGKILSTHSADFLKTIEVEYSTMKGDYTTPVTKKRLKHGLLLSGDSHSEKSINYKYLPNEVEWCKKGIILFTLPKVKSTLPRKSSFT